MRPVVSNGMTVSSTSTRHSGEHDLTIADLVRLTVVAVVVAAHRVEPLAEGAPVEPEECGVLLVTSVGGEVALHDHGGRIDRSDLGDRAGVHHLWIRRLSRLATKHGPVEVEFLEDAALGLAEVHVVDRGEPAQERPLGPRQRAYRRVEKRVVGVGLEPIEAMGSVVVVEDDLVVRDRRELCCHSPYQGRARRAATGRAHQRPENRHAGVVDVAASSTGTGCGHVIVIAAMMAAISSSVGVGCTSATCGTTVVTAACSRACAAAALRASSEACADPRSASLVSRPDR